MHEFPRLVGHWIGESLECMLEEMGESGGKDDPHPEVLAHEAEDAGDSY